MFKSDLSNFSFDFSLSCEENIITIPVSVQPRVPLKLCASLLSKIGFSLRKRQQPDKQWLTFKHINIFVDATKKNAPSLSVSFFIYIISKNFKNAAFLAQILVILLSFQVLQTSHQPLWQRPPDVRVQKAEKD